MSSKWAANEQHRTSPKILKDTKTPPAPTIWELALPCRGANLLESASKSCQNTAPPPTPSHDSLQSMSELLLRSGHWEMLRDGHFWTRNGSWMSLRTNWQALRVSQQRPTSLLKGQEPVHRKCMQWMATQVPMMPQPQKKMLCWNILLLHSAGPAAPDCELPVFFCLP